MGWSKRIVFSCLLSVGLALPSPKSVRLVGWHEFCQPVSNSPLSFGLSIVTLDFKWAFLFCSQLPILISMDQRNSFSHHLWKDDKVMTLLRCFVVHTSFMSVALTKRVDILNGNCCPRGICRAFVPPSNYIFFGIWFWEILETRRS